MHFYSSFHILSSSDFDVKSITATLHKRATQLPRTMDILCALPIQYINNRIGAREYATKHLDIAAELYRKIEFNHADDDYKTNYSTEIEMIKKLSKACDDYNLGHVSTDEFNTHIEDALSEYVMTDFKKSKYFID